MQTNRHITRQRTWTAIAVLALSGMSCQLVLAQSPAANAKQSSTATNAPAAEGDSIDQRAQRARMLEEAGAAAELAKLRPAPAQNSLPVAAPTKKLPPGLATPPAAPPRNEFYVEAIRGFEDKLEAALVMNGRRVTASTTFPTLIDGWSIDSVSVNGVVITKGKDRQALAFVGHDPHQPASAPAAGQPGFSANLSGIPPGAPGAFATPGR